MKKQIIKLVSRAICIAVAGSLFTGVGNLQRVASAAQDTVMLKSGYESGLVDLKERETVSYIPPSDFKNYKNGVSYGKINKVTYYSSVTGTSRKCNIYLPPNYNANKKYPVLYLLHGIGGTEDEWVYGGAPNQIISNQIASRNAKDMIVVMPNVRAAANDGVPSDILGNANVAAFDNFINDLRTCLMPYINKNYPVLTGRENTAIAGLSMGGRESLNIGFQMLNTFGYIGAFSPAPGLASTLSIGNGNPTPYFVNVMCGDKDSVVGTTPTTYHQRLSSNNVNHLWYTIPGDHNFDVWNVGLYNFIGKIFNVSNNNGNSQGTPNGGTTTPGGSTTPGGTTTTGKLTLDYNTNNWGSQYQVNFKITNKSDANVNTWTLKIKKSEINIKTSWCVNVKEDGDYYVITPMDYNSSIAKGNSIEFGIQGNGAVGSTISYTLS